MVIQQRNILVAAFENLPYILYDAANDKWSGVFVDALNAVCERIKYNCTYIRVPEIGLPDYQDGPTGAVWNGTADVGLIASKVTTERSQILHYIPSLTNRTYSVLVHQRHLITDNSSGAVLHALDNLYTNEVWLALFSVIVCSFVMISLIEWTYAYFQHKVISICNLLSFVSLRIIGGSLGLHDISGGINFPKTVSLPCWWPNSKHVFIVPWLFYTVAILSTVTGRMSVLFALEPAQRLPFTDAKSLAKSDFGLYAHSSSLHDLLKVSAAFSEHPQLFTKLRHTDRTNRSYAYYASLGMSGRNALVVNNFMMQQFANETREMFVAIDSIVVGEIACLVLRKNSELAESFVYGYARIGQEGIVHALMKRLDDQIRNASRRFPDKSDSSLYRKTGEIRRTTSTNLIGLKLNDLSAIFAALCFAYASSLCILIFEALLHRLILSVSNQF